MITDRFQAMSDCHVLSKWASACVCWVLVGVIVRLIEWLIKLGAHRLLSTKTQSMTEFWQNYQCSYKTRSHCEWALGGVRSRPKPQRLVAHAVDHTYLFINVRWRHRSIWWGPAQREICFSPTRWRKRHISWTRVEAWRIHTTEMAKALVVDLIRTVLQSVITVS